MEYTPSEASTFRSAGDTWSLRIFTGRKTGCESGSGGSPSGGRTEPQISIAPGSRALRYVLLVWLVIFPGTFLHSDDWSVVTGLFLNNNIVVRNDGDIFNKINASCYLFIFCAGAEVKHTGAYVEEINASVGLGLLHILQVHYGYGTRSDFIKINSELALGKFIYDLFTDGWYFDPMDLLFPWYLLSGFEYMYYSDHWLQRVNLNLGFSRYGRNNHEYSIGIGFNFF